MANEKFNIEFNDNFKDYIVFKLINKKKNEELLSKVPHITYLDLAIVFYYLLPGFDADEGGESFMIRNQELEFLNLSVDELLALAKENTPRLLGLKIQGILSTIAEYMDDIDLMLAAEKEESYVPLYVATNRIKSNGAGVILYKDMLDAISAKLNSDLYVIPSSIHEVILVRVIKDCQVDTSSLKDMISYVNKTELQDADILSDSLYYYSRENKALEFAQ